MGVGWGTGIFEFHDFGEFSEIHEFHKFCDRSMETGCAVGRWAVRETVLCIICFAYPLLEVLLLLFIPFFVVLLKCLYLNPQVLFFVCSPSHPTERGED